MTATTKARTARRKSPSLASDPAFNPEILPGQLSLPADWRAVFGRSAPLVVEIGCGKGTWLLGQAAADPDRNYLAIERAWDYFKVLRERAVKRRMPNLRVCRTDAADLIANCFGPQCVSVYHVYFPDPWPKARHQKRRLLTPEFCATLRRTLRPEGELFFATDHQGYAEEAIPALRTAFAVTEHPEPWPDAPKGRTNYEIKYLREGRPIWRLIARPK